MKAGAIRDVLRHRHDFCTDCDRDGMIVEAVTADGYGVVVIKLVGAEHSMDLTIAPIPHRVWLTDDGSDPLCRDCDRARCEKSVNCYLEGNDL
jgi:hypothetical protein